MDIKIMLQENYFKEKYKFNGLTPVMQQYLNVKMHYQDCLVLFRMGDFYELFYEDATIVSSALGLTLTSRNKNDEDFIPMCGIPHHALDLYLTRLIDLNYKIAICDQVESIEDAKKRGYKAIVNREVTQVITPSTIIDENLINTKVPNYLSSIVNHDNNLFTICYVDLSTGEFCIIDVNHAQLYSYLNNLSPKEILISEQLNQISALKELFQTYKKQLIIQANSYFSATKCKKIIENFYKINTVNAIGEINNCHISAIGAVLEYINITQKNNPPKLPIPKIIDISGFMLIDSVTKRNLEIVRSIDGSYQGSLLSIIDYTLTKQGSRLLYKYISNPLVDINKINNRLEIIELLCKNTSLNNKIRPLLKLSGDIERSLAKISMRRASPQDLLIIQNTIKFSIQIKEIIYNNLGFNLPILFEEIIQNLPNDLTIYTILKESIKEEPNNNVNNGGFIKETYHPRVQELSQLIENSTNIINQLRIKYQEQTGIDNLKICQNNIWGLFIEVSNKQAYKITSEIFLHKQTTTNSVRFTTEELKKLDIDILNAKNLVINLEKELFYKLCDTVLQYSSMIYNCSNSIALLDVFCSLSYVAMEYKYVKPIIKNDLSFVIEGGKHPVVEQSLLKNQEHFISNNITLLRENYVLLLTGPNMAGKSTFLRQNALIAILAQMGSFVPATYAEIGIVDKLFTRIGANDDLNKGQSTFMVEMVETSAILSQATKRSLIILDEVGRGTATYDGLAIAWSSLEYIHNDLQCRCLFATHYHELTDLSKTLSFLKNYTILVKELEDKIIFLHKIIEGIADKSYGIHVAQLAGIPNIVLKRANLILSLLEKQNNKISNLEDFEKNISNPGNQKYNTVVESIKYVNLDTLTPKQALDFLYKLKDECK